jgi:hypothetical protein
MESSEWILRGRFVERIWIFKKKRMIVECTQVSDI